MQLDDTRRLIASAQMAYDVVDWVAYHAAVKPNALATRELPSGRMPVQGQSKALSLGGDITVQFEKGKRRFLCKHV